MLGQGGDSALALIYSEWHLSGEVTQQGLSRRHRHRPVSGAQPHTLTL